MTARWGWLTVLLIVGMALTAFGLDNTFEDATLGYAIEYPADWVVERPSTYAVRFTGAAWIPASRVDFTIQNVASIAIGGSYADVAALLDDLKCQLVAGADDICIYIGETITIVDADGRTLAGSQIAVEYERGGGIYREWIAVVPHGSGEIFYVLTYHARREDYDRYEPTVLDMVRSWTIGGLQGAGVPATSSTTQPGSGDITVLLQDSGHIGPYDYAAGSYDKRTYDVTVTTHGYLAIAVIDEAGESISGWVTSPKGIEVMHKAGNFAEIYTDAYEVFPGTYELKVGQDTMVTESDFAVTVYFSTQPFTIDDLEAAFGSRYQVMP